MTRTLQNALAGRLAILTLATVTLTGMAAHTELNRPDSFHLNIPMDCYTLEGAPADCGL